MAIQSAQLTGLLQNPLNRTQLKGRESPSERQSTTGGEFGARRGAKNVTNPPEFDELVSPETVSRTEEFMKSDHLEKAGLNQSTGRNSQGERELATKE